MAIAPFKLTEVWIEATSRQQSKKFRDLRKRMAKNFMALLEKAQKIINLVEIMLNGQSDLSSPVVRRELLKTSKE